MTEFYKGPPSGPTDREIRESRSKEQQHILERLSTLNPNSEKIDLLFDEDTSLRNYFMDEKGPNPLNMLSSHIRKLANTENLKESSDYTDVLESIQTSLLKEPPNKEWADELLGKGFVFKSIKKFFGRVSRSGREIDPGLKKEMDRLLSDGKEVCLNNSEDNKIGMTRQLIDLASKAEGLVHESIPEFKGIKVF